jgi:hypothetical protein
MALIKMNLQNSFVLVPEGERVLEITKAACKPSGKPTAMHVTFKDEVSGGFLNNRYDFSVPGAMTAMSIMINYALGLEDGDQFDTIKDTPRLVGKKLVCEVTHAEGNKPGKDGKIPVFANIGKVIGKYEETGEVITTPTTSARKAIATDDLD